MATLPDVMPHRIGHGGVVTQVPILILNVHSHCNCRCLMCDIWQRDTRESVRAIDLEHHRISLQQLGVRHVVLTGGEPLLNTDLAHICEFFHGLHIRLTLLTTGLLLKKRAEEVAANFDDVIVSIDGPAAIHDGIRRVPGAFERIREGIAAVRSHRPRLRITARCTIQKANHLHIEDTVRTAKEIGLDAVSFLAVDTSSEAFNRPLLWPVARQSEIALTASEADAFDRQLNQLTLNHADDFASGFIAETPEKLRKIARTFRAHLGEATVVSPICNAPWVSAVVEIDGAVRPCFFHPPIGNLQSSDLQSILLGPRAQEFRASLDVATNATCNRCVCSLNYRAKLNGQKSANATSRSPRDTV
jgi:MoaA/NifB/PqqE/SkfB family radical SAM enzyme